MRILVISHEYPPIGGGGGKVAQDLSTAFAAAGNSVRVISAQYGDLPFEETHNGVSIRRIKSGRSQPFRAGILAMAGFVCSGLIAALQEVKSWHPDLIHVHFAVPAGPIAWVVNLFTGVPYVLTAHLGDVPGGTPEKTGKWFKWIFPFTPPIWKRAAKVVAVSEFTRQLALEHYQVPIQVIPNGVALENINPQTLSSSTPPGIVFAGRFMQQKDPVRIVETLAACQDLAWKCSMLGDGPLMPEVKEAIHKAGLENRFDLPGWVTPEQVKETFLTSDILLMPSLSEGLPVVGVQALSAGLAFAVSKIGGFIDLVEDGVNGYLIPPGEDLLWQQSIRQLLSSPQTLLTFRKASLKIAQRFDLPLIAKSYLQLFDKVLSEKNEHN